MLHHVCDMAYVENCVDQSELENVGAQLYALLVVACYLLCIFLNHIHR